MIALAHLLAAALVPQAGPAQSAFRVEEVTHGFDTLLPHRIAVPDASGNPTAVVVPINSLDDLVENVTPQNGVLPSAGWPLFAQLPNNLPGNHFLAAHFSRPIDLTTVLDPSPSAGAVSQLLGSIRVLAFDPVTGSRTQVSGRAFIGGYTYAGTPTGNPPTLPLQRWFTDVGGLLVANPAIDNDGNGVPDGFGFPGTVPGTDFPGADGLASLSSFVFLPDIDGDLATYEPFPSLVIQIEIDGAVISRNGQPLETPARVASHVMFDLLGPEILTSAPPNAAPLITPGNGDVGVDPTTTIELRFSEPVQPSSFGALTGVGQPALSSAVSLSFGSQPNEIQVPYTALPASHLDLSSVVLTPAFPFPGTSMGTSPACATLNRVDVAVQSGQVQDLGTNVNLFSVASFFETGEGTGLVNAPVAPDAIYAGLVGNEAALSVVDLNGFGGGTGDPTYDPAGLTFQEGWSQFPNNPNVRLQGSLLLPPLQPGACTVDGGSAGVFTRTLDSNLDPRLARSPVLLDVSDLALGGPLDSTFNNAPAPFGCQAGGGNLCAVGGLKHVLVTVGGPNTVAPAGPMDPFLNRGVGVGNLISWAPSPNPPPLSFPPLCTSPFLGGQESTSVETAGAGLINLLVPGDPFGNPGNGIPPSGLLSAEQNAWFQGPSPPQISITACQPYMIRQQVGHFLYGIDRVRRELVILNSNRMTPIERIALPDPTRLAVSPALDLLAVTNQRAGTVSFIDISPASSTFHTVVKTTSVGLRPSGIAWESLNEDILVCNEGDSSLSILSAFSLDVRKTVQAPSLVEPFDVVITPRQSIFASGRNVYYGYVLGRDGRVSIFESGPDGLNGWGYDDVIGRARYVFSEPKALQVDVTDLESAVWVAHEGKIDVMTGQAAPAGTGALSRLEAVHASAGLITLIPGSAPGFRQLQMTVASSLGEEVLSGIPIALALDDLRNLGALLSPTTPFSPSGAFFNGKALVRDSGSIVPASAPNYLFVAIPDAAQPLLGGEVDVVNLTSLALQDTNPHQPGVQSVPMPGVRVLTNYFKQ